MRNGGDVLDARDADAESVESADGRFAAGAGAHDAHFDVLQTEFLSNLAGVFGGHLSGKGRALAGALEALSACGGGGDGIALTIGNGDDRVVDTNIKSCLLYTSDAADE